MNKLIVIFFCGCIVIPSWLKAQETPRLLLAKKGEHIAFFLPVTHVATMVEKDAYWENLIEKVISKSDVLIDESAMGVHIASYLHASCGDDDVLELLLQKQLNYEYKKILKHDRLKLKDDRAFPIQNFGKMFTVFVGPILPINKGKQKNDSKHLMFPITLGAVKKYSIKNRSIEQIGHFFSAYCELSKVEKAELVNEVIKIRNDSSVERDPQLTENYKSIISEVQKEIAHNLPQIKFEQPKMVNGRSFGYQKFLFGLRNKMWIREIIENTGKQEIPFYALGADHFISNASGSSLVGLLQSAGFDVSIIRNWDDVPSSIKNRLVNVRPTDIKEMKSDGSASPIKK